MINAIDLFAGGGGFTTGATKAGVNVRWAANHWPIAVECHSRNHQNVEHVCQDLHQADWSKVPSCDLVLASPCCQGHTKARGKDRAHHDASRSTAWAVVSCCEYHRPKAFIVENVAEFLDWRLYPSWLSAMQLLGYKISTNILDAADAGTPQNRVRLFVVGTRSQEIHIPKPHFKAIPASEIIDFSAGNWSEIRKPGRAEATLAIIANGRQKLGRRFVFSYYGETKTGRSLDRPLGTVTTRDRWAVVDGDYMRMLTIDEYRQFSGFPRGYWLPKTREPAIELLGNSVPPPLARHVVSHVAEAIAA